jgi:glucosamine-6-phosphate deaminase
MVLIRTKDFNEMSKKAFEVIQEQMKSQAQPVISFTTGGSQTEIFRLLVEAINHQGLDISNSICLNIDEYVGPKDAVYSVNTFMHKEFYSQIKQQPKEIHLLQGDAKDQAAEVARYGAILERYPLDVQLLGLGVNGHFGANEPGTPLDSCLFVADLEPSTIKSTMNLFKIANEKDAPKQMYSMGYKEVMAAKTVLMVASGKSKQEAVRRLIQEEMSLECPSSNLKRHPNFVLIVDEEAYALCN